MLMKAGVLTFGYDHFVRMEAQAQSPGFYTINLGDNMQSLAIRHVLAEAKVPVEQTLPVNRDAMRDYSGEPVALLMNGCFYDHCFPIPPAIKPVFIGFQAAEKVIQNNLEELKRHAPIGCRDTHTTTLLNKYGVEAFTTGCLTLALPRRAAAPAKGRVFLVFGTGAGAFPAAVLRHMPQDLLSTAEFVYQRMVVTSHPRTGREMAEAEHYAHHLLKTYRAEASLVVTPLHHAATPCIAAGVPVVLCRARDDTRFSFLSSLMPIYGVDRLQEIDWRPEPVDIDVIRANLIRLVKEKLVPLLQ
jgi:hypothetical protein